MFSSELRDDGNASFITAEITPWLDEQMEIWPAGYSYQFGGDAKNTADNMGAVVAYLPLSGFIILLLLIIQFNSFRKTTMVISTVPTGCNWSCDWSFWSFKKPFWLHAIPWRDLVGRNSNQQRYRF